MVEGARMLSLVRQSSIGKLDSQIQIFQNVLWEREVILILGDYKDNKQEK